MHELSIAAGILEVIAPKVEDRSLLAQVHITIGPLAGIFSESLVFCFEELAKAEGFSNARLVLKMVDAFFLCKICGRNYSSGRIDIVCPGCGCMDREVISGRECTIDAIELEE